MVSNLWLLVCLFCLSVWAAAMLFLVVSTFASVVLHPRLRRVDIPNDLPSLALIRPIAGLEYRMAEVTASALDQDHPNIKIIFAVSSEEDPALPLILEFHEAVPVRSRVVFGERTARTNPKLNNMAGGVRDIDASFLFFSDGNTLLDATSARRWQAQAMALGGVVSALPEGIDPRSLAAWTECAFLNQHHLRLVLTLDLLGVPTVHGKAMNLSSAHFTEIGGIDALRRYPAEDFAMAQAAQARAIPIQVSDTTARTPLGPRSWRAMIGRQRRWAQLRAGSAPASLLGEFVLLMVPSGAAGSLAFASFWDIEPGTFLFCHALSWLFADLLIAKVRGQAISLWSPLASLIREVSAPGILLAGMLGRQIEWGGHVFSATRRS